MPGRFFTPKRRPDIPMTEERYREVYALLNTVEVTGEDCGKLCGCACCTTESREGTDQEMGIYLLPGEETVHRQDSVGFCMPVKGLCNFHLPVCRLNLRSSVVRRLIWDVSILVFNHMVLPLLTRLFV